MFSAHLIFARSLLEVNKVSFRSRITGYSFFVQYFARRLPELLLAVLRPVISHVLACVYPLGKLSHSYICPNIWAFFKSESRERPAQTHSYCISFVKKRRECMRARLHNLPIMRASFIAHVDRRLCGIYVICTR